MDSKIDIEIKDGIHPYHNCRVCESVLDGQYIQINAVKDDRSGYMVMCEDCFREYVEGIKFLCKTLYGER